MILFLLGRLLVILTGIYIFAVWAYIFFGSGG